MSDVCGSDGIVIRLRRALNNYRKENKCDPKFIVLNNADAEEAFSVIINNIKSFDADDLIGDAKKEDMKFNNIPVVVAENSLKI